MMIRSFLPVGQGAFYCEQFMWNFETERINIVYDCGSSTNRNFDTYNSLTPNWYYKVLR